MKSLISILVFSTLLVLFLACSKDDDSSSKKVIEDACLLVPMSDAASITDDNYNDFATSETDVVGLKLCHYTNEENAFFQVGVTQTAAISKDCGLKTAKEFYDATKLASTGVELISNVGDEAFIAGNTGFLNVLYGNDYYVTICVMQGGAMSGYLVQLWSASEKKAMKIAAGQKAIENLKLILGQ